MARARRPPRRTPEEGRQALLEAGRALAHEQPAAPPLDHIRLTDVARSAGVSSGALYHYWDTQDDYHDDLLDHLFEPGRFDPAANVAEVAAVADALTDEVGAPHPSLDEQIRIGASLELEGLLANADLRVLLALWAGGDAEVRDRIAGHFRSTGRRWADFYERAFRSAGLEVRPPFTYEMLAVVLAALADGLAVRASVEPEAVPVDLDDQGWGILAATLVALLPVFSRRVDTNETFWDFLDELRAMLSVSGDEA